MQRRTVITLLVALCFAMVLPQQGHAQDAGLKTVKMGVLLPLKEKSARGAKMVEFYQGLLLAVDSLKHEGLNVNVTALHSGASAAEMDVLLSSHSLAECDLVFGPLDSAQLPALADYCNIHDIRLISPFSTLATQVKGHPLFYLMNAPRYTMQAEAIWFIQSQFNDCNIVAVECNERNDEGSAFVEQMRTALSEQGIYVRQLNVNGDDIAYSQAFSPLRKNLVVLSSTSIKALNTFLPRLKAFRRENPDFTIALFGYPDWQTYTSQLLKDFYEQDTYVFTSFYRNPFAPRDQAFDSRFTSWFHHPMGQTFPRYGQMGFDYGYFFLRGLAIFGDQLEDNLDRVPANPFQHPLWFQRNDEADGFINTFVELIHYSPLQTIELMTRNR